MLTRLQPFFDERFVFATLTQLKKTSTAPYKKVQIRPFLQGGELTFQLTYVYDKKVLHENLSAPEAAEAVAGLLENTFCQCILHTTEHDYHMTCFSRLKIKTQPPTKAGEQNLSHNKQKAYAIPDGEPCDFLIHLGVMNADGHVLAISDYEPGSDYVYYWGFAWNKADIKTPEAWNQYMADFAQKVRNPLTVSISK